MKLGHLLVMTGALGLLASAFVCTTAQARSAGGMQGNALVLGNNCFYEANGGVANVCFSFQGYEVALPIDSAKSYAVTFESTPGTECVAQVFSQTNVFVGSSGFAFSSGGLTTVTSVAVPPGGIVYLYCGLPANDFSGNGGGLFSVNWN